MVPDWKTNGKTRTQADSFRDAARGFFHTVKTERNMRIHLTAAVYVLLLTIAMVIAAEAFNTAIEMLCDYAQKSYNPLIGKTKDIAAGAVLVCAVFAAFVGIAVLWRPEAILALLITIVTNPLYLVLFILSLILAFFFIFKVPCGVREKLHKK